MSAADRRAFFKLACAMSLLGPRALAEGRPNEPRLRARDEGLGEAHVRRGLAQISCAHRRGWASAHHGAAVLACHYFLLENQVDERTLRAVRAQADRFIAFHADEFRDVKRGSGRGSLGPIVDHLTLHIDELRCGGHDAIYASLVLRVMRDHPQLVTPTIVEGVVRTLRSFVKAQPPWKPTAYQHENPLPAYRDSDDLAKVTLNAMLRPWSAVLDQGSGNVVHWVTFANALITLDELGLDELARRGHVAHQLYINRPVWDDGRAAEKRPAVNWLSAEYWESNAPKRLQGNTWFFGHSFKFPHSLLRLLRRVDDPDLDSACFQRAAQLLASFE